MLRVFCCRCIVFARHHTPNQSISYPPTHTQFQTLTLSQKLSSVQRYGMKQWELVVEGQLVINGAI